MLIPGSRHLSPSGRCSLSAMATDMDLGWILQAQDRDAKPALQVNHLWAQECNTVWFRDGTGEAQQVNQAIEHVMLHDSTCTVYDCALEGTSVLSVVCILQFWLSVCSFCTWSKKGRLKCHSPCQRNAWSARLTCRKKTENEKLKVRRRLQ